MTTVGHLHQGSHKGAAGPLLLFRHLLGLPRGPSFLAASLCFQGQGGVGTPAHPSHCSPLKGPVTKGQWGEQWINWGSAATEKVVQPPRDQDLPSGGAF